MRPVATTMIYAHVLKEIKASRLSRRHAMNVAEADVHERRLLAGSSHRKPPRDSPLPDTLLTLIAPDSMRTTREKRCILGGERELPKAYGRGLGKWVAEVDRNRWRDLG